jgi:outer membrane receptor protein involved in Fe transport
LALVGDDTLVTSGQTVSSVSYSNLSLNYRVPRYQGLSLLLTVQNLLDEGAPPANFYGTQANVGLFGGFAIGDDPVGRFWTAGLRYRL